MSAVDDQVLVERELRLSHFRKGFAHGADPQSARRRVDSALAGDPSWRAGSEAGRGWAETAEEDFDDRELRPELAAIRDPERYKDIKPHPSVVTKYGRISAHPFEPPHDAPDTGGDPCWHCLRDRDDKVHRARRT